MNVSISISGRFHAFDLAWQMQKRGFLHTLITSYPKFKVKEWNIDPARVQTILSHELLCRGWRQLASRLRLQSQPDSFFLQRFDRIAAGKIPEDTDIAVAWSSAALRVLQRAKVLNAKAILERNSTHIVFQKDILIDEYARVGLRPQIPNPRIIERELEEYETADYICVPSTFAYRSYVEYGVPAAKVFTVPFGVDHHSFYPVAKQDSTFRIIHCGSLSIRKGVHYLLRAFHELRLKDAELWLIGPMSGEIAPYLNQYGGPNVHVRGTFPQAELYKEYSQGSVFSIASIEEGFAMVISQAMACGLPVVCTTNTTGEDIVRDGIDGYVLPIRDVEALKARLALLHSDQERCRAMGQSARQRVLGGFTWDHYGELMARQYSRIHLGQAPAEYVSDNAESTSWK
jgi:glycosyltransferase involved in cell wall biosynthesis